MTELDHMPGRHDFFVSYTGVDEVWAEWIAWHVGDLGFSVIFQKWDFGPGHSFVRQMDDALKQSDRVLAVLSERYLHSRFGTEEWHAKWAEGEGLVVPVRIDDVNPPGLLAGVVYIDLFDKSAEQAREILRVKLSELGPPAEGPAFPGDGPANDDAFPGNREFIRVPDRRMFTGRDAELEALAAASTPAVLTQVAVGMGGVGKTALALEYTHRYRSAFEWIGWVRAGSRPELVDGLVELAGPLGVSTADDAETTAVAVKLELARARFRWLLVVDNVTDPDEIKGLLPQTGVGQVVLTSRYSDWSGTTIAPIGVGVLPLEDAMGLLFELTGSTDADGAQAVAERLGRLAIALEQAGAAMRQRKWAFGRYLDMLANRPVLVFEDELRGLDRTVAEVLTSSIEQATADAPYAEAVLGVCAFLAPDHIQRLWLEGEAASGLELLADGDALKTSDAIGALSRYRIITATDIDISIHRLVQEIVRARFASEPDRQADAASTAMKIISQQIDWPSGVGSGAGTDSMNLATHIAAVLRNVQKACPELLAGGGFTNEMIRWASHERIASRFGPALVASSALYVVSTALDRSPAEIVNAGRICVAAMEGLGMAAEARRLAVTVDELDFSQPDAFDTPDDRPSSVQFGPEKINAVRSAADRAYRDGDHQRAIALKLSVLSATGWYFGHHSLETARAFMELAILCSETETERAAAFMQEAMPLFRRHLDDDDPEMALVRMNLAGIQLQSGDVEGARLSIESAVEFFRDYFDGPHQLLAAALAQLSLVLESCDELAAASDVSQEAIECFTDVHGEMHGNVAQALANWAKILRRLGMRNEAKTAASRAVDIYSSLYGPNSWETVWASQILETTSELDD